MKKRKNRINRISIFLDEVGLDQLELAKLLKVTNDTVSRWCRNATQPSLKSLSKIAELGHIDIRALLEPTEWDDNPSPIEIYLENKAKKELEDKKLAKQQIKKSK
ncbi:helix-turn-helix domain-containing protein [Mucilaginibacter paludis]|uniref:Helix-turn-helix domain protein n=1 Tax=Mucilaginibacter paludis DSM 18603 TaxID=714943 RepID=H1YBL7_9SPHI|nr:helix-turn-helix transcriptional regulator [Mucilaginibacter paludis]EHQ25088.1 helix-turn-helix domain protein [Mucilaginibacter paludis DSM 18603]